MGSLSNTEIKPRDDASLWRKVAQIGEESPANPHANHLRAKASPKQDSCRSCGGTLHGFVNLGTSPLCESFISEKKLDEMEPTYPLKAMICGACYLAQVKECVEPAKIFREYAYFSAFSETWLRHCRDYVDTAISLFRLDSHSQVVELASNDGYLLQYFVERGIPVLGIDPAENVGKAAEARAVPTLTRFFDAKLARELRARGRAADLIIGNNVLAQIPDLDDFIEGVALLLKANGTGTFEFPHLLQLIDGNQFDTIYHEHFWYFSLFAICRLFAKHGLRIFDVEELKTHGGSLRVFVCHEASRRSVEPRVSALIAREIRSGLMDMARYAQFGDQVRRTKHALLEFLIEAKKAGKRIVGYGAPGKANTLLNYCGIRTDFLDYTVDRNPYKHGKYMPGTRIPIRNIEEIDKSKPDYLVILPWNLKDEIMEQMAHVRDWGCRFVVPIPKVVVYP